LREEYRFRVFEIRVLTGVFGPKRDEITGEWRRLHNEEHYDTYLPNIILVTTGRRWAGHVARMGKTGAYRILLERPEGKGPI